VALVAYPVCEALTVEAVLPGSEARTAFVARLPLADAKDVPVRASLWTRVQFQGWFEYVHALHLRAEIADEVLGRIVATAAQAHPGLEVAAFAHQTAKADGRRLVLLLRHPSADELHTHWTNTFLDKLGVVPEACSLAQALVDDDIGAVDGLRPAWAARALIAWRTRRDAVNECFAAFCAALRESLQLQKVAHDTACDLSVNRATVDGDHVLTYRVNAQLAGEPDRLYYLAKHDFSGISAWTYGGTDRRSHAPILHANDIATEMTQRGYAPQPLPGLTLIHRQI